MDGNMKVIVKANKKASVRTKNRLRENGPIFIIITGPIKSNLLKNDIESILIRSDKKDYMGWFPISEIIIKEVEENNEN